MSLLDAARMDIAGIASAQKAQSLRADVDVGVLSKVKDQQVKEGQAAVKLISTSGPAPGASEPGKGGQVDVQA
ncbi:MAG: hypothetical protein AB8H80_05515 [Planctomycetota bacterium]